MRYPEFLPEGGRIGFIAPSFGAATEPYISLFAEAQARFSAAGYSCVLGPNCLLDEGIGKSNTPEKCGAEINDFFLKDKCDVIISCGGGETMCEDLPFVQFGKIAKARPKWYLGYSDNTNLTFTLPTLCDTAAVYGPCVSAFGMKPLHRSLTETFEFLQGRRFTFTDYGGWEKESLKSAANPFAAYNVTEPYVIRYGGSAKDGAAFSGRLIGGCLDCLANLAGTPFDKVKAFAERYREDGILWFLEACDLSPIGIRRALWQLDQAGWFKYCSGFLIGRALHYDEEAFGLDRISAVTSVLDKYNVPILLDVDLGHLPPMMPLIAGAVADVSASGNRLRLTHRLI